MENLADISKKLGEDAEPVQSEVKVETPAETPSTEVKTPEAKDDRIGKLAEVDIFDGIEDDGTIKWAREKYRGINDKETKSAFNALAAKMRRDYQRELKSKTAKLSEGEKKLSQVEIEKIRKDAQEEIRRQYEPTEIEASKKKIIEQFKGSEAEPILELFMKENEMLKREIDGIKVPLSEESNRRQQAAVREKYDGFVKAVHKEIGEHVDPFTIIDIQRQNEMLPEEERLSQDEMILAIQQADDERYEKTLPKRLESSDQFTIGLIKESIKKAWEKNAPWFQELRNDILNDYKSAKKIGGDGGTGAKTDDNQEIIKVSPRDIMSGKTKLFNT